jgi:hypothetical protein
MRSSWQNVKMVERHTFLNLETDTDEARQHLPCSAPSSFVQMLSDGRPNLDAGPPENSGSCASSDDEEGLDKKVQQSFTTDNGDDDPSQMGGPHKNPCSWTTDMGDDDFLSTSQSQSGPSPPNRIFTALAKVLTPAVQQNVQGPGHLPDPHQARRTVVKLKPKKLQRGCLIDAENQFEAKIETGIVVNHHSTTVILRNSPKDCSLNMALTTIDNEGFAGHYNFVHAPVDFATREAWGYILVNLVDHAVAARFLEHFQGFRRWESGHIVKKGCSAGWSTSVQGLEAHVERYRNSPLMHKSVPPEYRPALFHNGIRIAFPPPTVRIKPPRVRQRHHKGSLVDEDGPQRLGG